MNRLALVTVFALPLLFGCGQAPVIDSSSDEAFAQSVGDVAESLDGETRKDFERAMQALLFSDIQDMGMFEMAADAESGGLVRRFKSTLEGMTAVEVIAEADRVGAARVAKGQQDAVKFEEAERERAAEEEEARSLRAAEKDEATRLRAAEKEASARQKLAGELADIEKRLDEDAKAMGVLSKVVVLRSRFGSAPGVSMSKNAVELAVRNSTDKTLSSITFEGTLSTPGRSVSWVNAPIRYTIPGGMEPGESETWLLSPNFLSDWRNAPSDRIDTLFTVDVIDVVFAEGEPSPARCFAATDAVAARKVLEGANGADSDRIAGKLQEWELGRSERFDVELGRQAAMEIEELEHVADQLAAVELRDIDHWEPKTNRAISRRLSFTAENGGDFTILTAHFSVRIFTPGREVPWADGPVAVRFKGGLAPGETTTESISPRLLDLVPFDGRGGIEIEMVVQRLEDANGETIVERSESGGRRLIALREMVQKIEMQATPKTPQVGGGHRE